MDFNLNEKWAIQSSGKVSCDGDEISGKALDTGGWLVADLPATVIGALVENGVYEDPFFGMNLREIPGQGPFAENFSNHPMPDDSPFAVPWWFRKEFEIPPDAGSHLSLQFDGINYRANVWLNGELIADSNQVAGAYRDYEFDITSRVDRDGLNVLAVQVFPPLPCDVAITWVDWNPSPPDKNMGLWRDVWLKSGGPVGIRAPQVTTRLEGYEKAYLTIGGDLRNAGDEAKKVTVRATLEEQEIAFEVTVEPREHKRFDHVVELDSPRLWWPRTMGSPELYTIRLEAVVEGEISDSTSFDFGVREIAGELTDEGYAIFKVNSKPILIRGAGWATDLFLRRQPDRERIQYEYVKDMNLNTIRFEGMLERAEFLEWCDRDGILVIAGWCCCDVWEKWDEWKEENFTVAPESLRSQIRRIRRHPSMITWWYGSDFAPPPRVEKSYLDVFETEHWPNATQSSAANKPTELTGPSGMKMEGPYDYVPPGYWLEDTQRGGAFGFATEVCPGPAIPPIESLKKMLPKESLWPVNDVWLYHAGGQEFHSIQLYWDAVTARYGAVDSIEEFAEISQVVAYEAQRAMFEAYARNKFTATGVVQWMLNNSWPSLIWHLFDYYLRPAGGYFGSKKACEPLHVQYSYDDRTVYVVNDYEEAFRGLRVEAKVISLEQKVVFEESASVVVSPGGKTHVLQLPEFDEKSSVYFVNLTMSSAEGEKIGRNFYWVSAKPDVLDHEKGFWIHTPCKEFADLSALRDLPKTSVDAMLTESQDGEGVAVEIYNPGDKLAFFVQARLSDENGDDVLPVFWSDNYVSLMPKENCVLRVKLPDGAVRDSLQVHIGGVNVVAQTLVFPLRKNRVG